MQGLGALERGRAARRAAHARRRRRDATVACDECVGDRRSRGQGPGEFGGRFANRAPSQTSDKEDGGRGGGECEVKGCERAGRRTPGAESAEGTSEQPAMRARSTDAAKGGAAEVPSTTKHEEVAGEGMDQGGEGSAGSGIRKERRQPRKRRRRHKRLPAHTQEQGHTQTRHHALLSFPDRNSAPPGSPADGSFSGSVAAPPVPATSSSSSLTSLRTARAGALRTPAERGSEEADGFEDEADPVD